MKTVAIVSISALFGTVLAVSALAETPNNAATNVAAPKAMSTATPASSATDNSAPTATPGTASAPAVNTAAPASSSTPAKAGTVARATLTTGVVDREPVDRISTITNDKSRVYYFTELHDMAGQSVTHRWEHNGKVMSEVKLDVGGPRWRVYSSKTLDPSLTGEWKVSVVDANGATVGANTFSYTTASVAGVNGTNANAAANATAQPATPTSTAAPAGQHAQ